MSDCHSGLPYDLHPKPDADLPPTPREAELLRRIRLDAEVIKAAEEMEKVLDNVTGKTWAATVDMEDACKVDTALADFRKAQQVRAALKEKNDD